MKKTMALIAVVVMGLSACTQTATNSVSGSSNASPTTKVSKPKPPPSILIRGTYAGVCKDVAHSSNLTDVHLSDPVHWHFTVLSTNRLKMFSASGGYSMILDRTGKANFYGSTTLPSGGGWERAYKMVVKHFDSKGIAETFEVFDTDRITGAYSAYDKSTCHAKHL